MILHIIVNVFRLPPINMVKSNGGNFGTVGAERSPESFPKESTHRKHMLSPDVIR
ncbi:hypothetical protein M2444_006712 [Paenibacillus sp. PastF-3]|nr:hypothetical protein [Paenibacillus sp. PastF-3]